MPILAPLKKNSKRWHQPQSPPPNRQQPKRAALPAGLPRVDIHHEPDSTTCGCGCGCDCACKLKRIGQDISEKLDYTPGVFTVEQHIRGKWACAQCETLIQAPVAHFHVAKLALCLPKRVLHFEPNSCL